MTVRPPPCSPTACRNRNASMPPNAFSDLFAYLIQLMTANAPMFEAMGNRLYSALTVIVVVWFGIEWALKGGMPMDSR